MDCYDLYVHELLMNTNAKIPSIFKEKKNIVNKIRCLIKDIRSKSYWLFRFNNIIFIQDDEYIDGGADNHESFSDIDFDNIVYTVNKELNVELYPLYNIEDISFDNLKKSYLLLLIMDLSQLIKPKVILKNLKDFFKIFLIFPLIWRNLNLIMMYFYLFLKKIKKSEKFFFKLFYLI